MDRCSSCKKDVPEGAKFCPACGRAIETEKPKKNDDWRNLGIAGAIIVAVFFLASTGDTESEREPKAQPSAREQRINRGFSIWNGSHRALTGQNKANLKDPSSFEHVETRYTDHGDDTLTVTTHYRAKNSFGALVVGHVTAKVHIDGHVIEIISSQ